MCVYVQLTVNKHGRQVCLWNTLQLLQVTEVKERFWTILEKCFFEEHFFEECLNTHFKPSKREFRRLRHIELIYLKQFTQINYNEYIKPFVKPFNKLSEIRFFVFFRFFWLRNSFVSNLLFNINILCEICHIKNDGKQPLFARVHQASQQLPTVPETSPLIRFQTPECLP